MKYNLEKDQHPGNKKNTADDVQNVMNMISTSHPFLKEIVQTSGKPPNLICYTEHQLKHFSSAVKTSVIGVDRTFNLGPCYVTTTVFQEKKLQRKGTNTNPIILGPLYLHWDGAFHTYQRFFTHLASVLGTEIESSLLSTNDMVIGTDEEKALVKALKSSFPESKLTLCTRHLGENFKRHLKNKVGMNEKNSKKVVDDIFGENGLISADTTVDLTSKISEIETKYTNSVGPYLSEKVIPTIKEYIYNVRKYDNKVPLHWKNNNCESLNHILKLNQNWTPNRLPELIQNLHKEIQLQEALIKGALYGHGDFELDSHLLNLQCTKAQWQSKTENEKENLFKKFLSFGTKQPPQKFVTSTDGKLLLPKTATVARKPGQKRRIKSTKTVTNKRQKHE